MYEIFCLHRVGFPGQQRLGMRSSCGFVSSTVVESKECVDNAEQKTRMSAWSGTLLISQNYICVSVSMVTRERGNS